MRAVSCAHIIITVSLEESECRKVSVTFSAIESRFSCFIRSPLFFFKQIRRFARFHRCLPLSLLVTFQCTFITEVTDFRRSTAQRFLIFEVSSLSKLHININPYFFYIHGSVYFESNLITVQQDATYSVYYISAGNSTCSGCWHPPSGARITVITASGID